MTKANLILPDTIITLSDLGHLQREIEQIDTFIMQSNASEAGAKPSLPRTSKTLEKIAKDYQMQLLEEEDRKKLNDFFVKIRESAPTLHISFAAEPSATFLEKLIAWMRDNIHPQLLLQVGLQPTIAAGCIIRTENKYFDFSMRKNFANQTDKLISSIQEVKDE